VPRQPENSEEWSKTDKERLAWVLRHTGQLLRDHNTIVQAVEQLKLSVRTLEDYKLALETRIDTMITLAKVIGIANAFNLLAFGALILYRVLGGKAIP
jgi:hypothetical protein